MATLPAEVHSSIRAGRAEVNMDPTFPHPVGVNCVRFSRPPSSPDGALRNFDADVEASGAGDQHPLVVGRFSGRVGWLAWLPEYVDNSPDERSARAIGTSIRVGNYLSAELDSPIESVLIVEDLWLEPSWRGAGLARRIAEQLIDVLLLTPEITLVLGVVEPKLGPREGLAPVEAWPGSHGLADEYRDAGFERWLGGNAWFLRPAPED